jgi:phosphate transport system substrate-binding protein
LEDCGRGFAWAGSRHEAGGLARKLAWAALMLLLGGQNGCKSRSASGGRGETIVVTGSSTIAPVASELGRRFEMVHPGVRVDVQTGGSSRGVLDARQGLADVGMVSREMKPDEVDLKNFLIARDGIALIVHRSNLVKSLSFSEIVGIYTGAIASWKDVGGADRPITVISKAEGRSTLELFLHYFKLKNSQIKASVIVGDNEQDIKTIAGNADAIGYVSIGTAEVDIGSGVPIKLLPLEGVVPSSASVQNGSFPLSRELNLVTKTIPTGIVGEFIEFAQSPAAAAVISEQHFIVPRKS